MPRLQSQSAPQLRQSKKKGGSILTDGPLGRLIAVVAVVLCLAAAGLLYEFSSTSNSSSSGGSSLRRTTKKQNEVPPLFPIFAPIPNADQLMEETYDGKPSVLGVIAILQKFIYELHMTYGRLAKQRAHREEIINSLFALTQQHLGRLDETYRGKSIFPIHEEEQSIFLSLAAFREHLLTDTMVGAFSHAKNPEKLFIGAVVQNCFGKVMEDGVTIDSSGLPCRTGVQVVGKDEQGRPMTKVSDAPPDPNGIHDFCNLPDYKKYCDNGQIRVLWVHESESMGPAMARYYASKLWGGETYFMQTDSHLKFAQDWDQKYRDEIQATRNYPKSILTSYPPGFSEGSTGEVKESPGARLCTCMTRLDDPNPIVRINTGVGYKGNEPRPTQIPFIAAGFFFARAEFLIDVPFDPYMPWLFMGEELALSCRSWTSGWNIYAPRKNLIAHQYRPGRLGLPKFWESVNNLFAGSTGNNRLQQPLIKRVKHLLDYPDATVEKIKEENFDIVLTDFEHYRLGKERTWDEYMKFAHMGFDKDMHYQCSPNPECNNGLLE